MEPPPIVLLLPHRKPTLSASAIDGDSAAVNVTAPTTGGEWASYNITLCVVASQGAAPGCTDVVCKAAVGSPLTTCPLEGLEALTTYRVSALAEKAGQGGTVVASPVSDPGTVTTPDHEYACCWVWKVWASGCTGAAAIEPAGCPPCAPAQRLNLSHPAASRRCLLPLWMATRWRSLSRRPPLAAPGLATA